MKRSPWGPIHQSKVLAEGVTKVTTATHGGIKLARQVNSKIPEVLRRSNGWYEEDIEWAIPALFLPEAFPGQEADALRVVKSHWPDQYSFWSGVEVPLEESRVLQKRKFERDNLYNYVTKTTWGYWHPNVPQGHVGVLAVQEVTADERYFLVPMSEYDCQPTPFGFVVNPEKHQPWIGPDSQVVG